MTRVFDANSWLWDDALAALELAERRQRRFFAFLGARGCDSVWEPPVDVFETDREILIVIALPGVSPDDIELRVEATELVVHTVRALRDGIQSMHIRRLEIPYGAFERRIALPAGHYTLLDKRVINGCLELHLTRE
jgi:HSP20 family protein